MIPHWHVSSLPAFPDETGSGKENVAPAEDGSRPGLNSDSSEDEEPPRTASASRRSRLVSSDEENGGEPGSSARR